MRSICVALAVLVGELVICGAELPREIDPPATWRNDTAWTASSATRQRTCLNGVWRFAPALPSSANDAERKKWAAMEEVSPLPADAPEWGRFPVPGVWFDDGTTPATMDVIAGAGAVWEAFRPENAYQVWFSRPVTVPADWDKTRHIWRIAFDSMQRGKLRIFVDGKSLGQVPEWPRVVDITDHVEAGRQFELTLLYEDQRLSSKRGPRQLQLASDVYLDCVPSGARIGALIAFPSVRNSAITFAVRPENLDSGQGYELRLICRDADGAIAQRFECGPLDESQLRDGYWRVTFPWKSPRLWELDDPHLYTVAASLESGGQQLDQLPTQTFGFREMWVQGRHLLLNGIKTQLSCNLVALKNGWRQSRLGAEEFVARQKERGFNIVRFASYGHDYTYYLPGLLDAADRMGFMLEVYAPGIRADAPFAERAAGYRANLYRRLEMIGNHPSLVAWWVWYPGHYLDNQNPLRTDSTQPLPLLLCAKAQALEAPLLEAVKAVDPSRLFHIFNCSTLGEIHSTFYYLSWAHPQSRAEWLSLMACRGEKPVYAIEVGMPYSEDFTGYRPQGGSKMGKIESLHVEYAAAWFGDSAYDLNAVDLYAAWSMERDYARKFKLPFSTPEQGRAGDRVHNYLDVLAGYYDRYMESWRFAGLSGACQWIIWHNLGHERVRQPDRATANWTPADMQSPGIHAAREARSDNDLCDLAPLDCYGPNPARDAHLRVTAPLMAAIRGTAEHETESACNYRPGESIRRVLAVSNQSRRAKSVEVRWRAVHFDQPLGSGEFVLELPAGESGGKEICIEVPGESSDATIELSAEFAERGSTPFDRRGVKLNVVAARTTPKLTDLAIYDPLGLTRGMLLRLGIDARMVDPDDDLTGVRTLIIGREAIQPGGRLFDLRAPVEQGMTVVVFEQSAEALETRMGLRVNEPMSREVFVRSADHPALAGLTESHLRNWRGAGTTMPEHLATPDESSANAYPSATWCGFENPRVWKWGNNHLLSAVAIEKPQTGNFLPILDCGFDLQYSPLLEMRHGGGAVILCQLDVSRRVRSATPPRMLFLSPGELDQEEPDPAADRLVVNVIEYANRFRAMPSRRLLYLGDAHSAAMLERLGVGCEKVASLDAASPGSVLIVGDMTDADDSIRQDLSRRVEAGLTVIAMARGESQWNSLLPFSVATETAWTLHGLIDKPAPRWLEGVGRAEFHWRTFREVGLLRGLPATADVQADGLLARVPHGTGAYVLLQFDPRGFDPDRYEYLRPTARNVRRAINRIIRNAGGPMNGESRLLAYLAQPLRESDAAVDVSLPPDAWRRLANIQRTENSVDAERAANYSHPGVDLAGWSADQAAGPATAPDNSDATVWHRIEFELEGVTDRPATLAMGAVAGFDWTFLNGQLVGHVGSDTTLNEDAARQRRLYSIAPNVLRRGRNVLLIQVRATGGDGRVAEESVTIRFGGAERWLNSYYVDRPVFWDDPYRHVGW